MNEISTIQIKVRTHQDDELTWETRPVLMEYDIFQSSNSSNKKFTSALKSFVKYLCANPIEIRWNWKNSLQGHYILMTGKDSINL